MFTLPSRWLYLCPFDSTSSPQNWLDLNPSPTKMDPRSTKPTIAWVACMRMLFFGGLWGLTSWPPAHDEDLDRGGWDWNRAERSVVWFHLSSGSYCRVPTYEIVANIKYPQISQITSLANVIHPNAGWSGHAFGEAIILKPRCLRETNSPALPSKSNMAIRWIEEFWVSRF